MRGAVWTGMALAAGVLAGCHREPSFDERYAAAQKAIGATAAAIDAELAARASEAAEADSVATSTPTGTSTPATPR